MIELIKRGDDKGEWYSIADLFSTLNSLARIGSLSPYSIGLALTAGALQVKYIVAASIFISCELSSSDTSVVGR